MYALSVVLFLHFFSKSFDLLHTMVGIASWRGISTGVNIVCGCLKKKKKSDKKLSAWDNCLLAESGVEERKQKSKHRNHLFLIKI